MDYAEADPSYLRQDQFCLHHESVHCLAIDLHALCCFRLHCGAKDPYVLSLRPSNDIV